MDTIAYNPHNFSLQTKNFEQQSLDSALSKAEELAQEKTTQQVQRVSRKICNEAYSSFKQNIEATFPSDDYKDLISLTLKSRENFFFQDLKERVISILRQTNTSDFK